MCGKSGHNPNPTFNTKPALEQAEKQKKRKRKQVEIHLLLDHLFYY